MDDGTVGGDDVPRRGLAVARVDALRAGAIVVLFCVALALLLGPAGNRVGAPRTTTTLRHHKATPVAKNKTTVQVANGTSVTGVAHSWAKGLLEDYGWAALPAVSTVGFRPPHTWIYFKKGQQLAGKLLAQELHVDHRDVVLLTQQASNAVPGAANDDVVIVIGRDHHGEGPPATV